MIYRFQDFAADIDAGCLTRAGAEVHLRRKSFQVLAILLENHTRLVTKEEIFATVWPDLAVTDDVLVGVIGELRKALSDSVESPVFIRTSRRAGYRFVAPVEVLEPAAAASPAAAPDPVPAAAARQPVGRRRFGVWLAAGVLAGGAAGWLLAGGFHPRLVRKAPLSAREVAWWRFDEASGDAVRDATGHGNDGVLHGGARRTVGPVGPAVDLDGVRGWIGGTARSLPAPGEPLTFSAWLQVAETSIDFTNVFQYGHRQTASAGGFLTTFLTLIRPDGRWEVEGEAAHPIVGGRIADGAWRHVVVRYDGAQTGGASVYTDGVEQARGRWLRQSDGRADDAWSIGQFTNIPATFLHGRIADVRLFRGALTPHQINALWNCSAPREGVPFGRSSYYFLPLYASIVDGIPGADGRIDGVRNTGRDFAGAQFARREDSCAVVSLEGADVGQDVHISAELLTPRDAAGHHTQAGPFFRSRLAAPGDGIMGGTSAGYWVALDSIGAVSIRRLNPLAVVAFAHLDAFDPAVFHSLEAVAVGERLQVKLDGQLLRFDQEGRVTTVVSIAPVWNGPPAIGTNQGGAGIEFAAIDSRGEIGGQEARRVRVERASSLWK